MGKTCQDFQETGFAAIDEDHREIGSALEVLLEAVNGTRPEVVLRALDDLLDRCTVHFAREQRLMGESGYPLAGRHKEAHDLFLADGRRAFVELKRTGHAPTVRRWATGRLLAWFRFHIAANDVGLGLYLLARDAKCKSGTVVGRAGVGRAPVA